jgi:transcriptional regulator of acetoin/glycerol metabolism
LQDSDTDPVLETSQVMRAGAPDGDPRRGLQLRFAFPALLPPLSPGAGETVVIGREVEGAGRLEGNGVSRRHAELRRAGGQLVLRDLDSRNGVFVNGVRSGEIALREQDVVRVGDWVGVVVAGDLADAAGAAVDDAGPMDDPRLHLGPGSGRLAAAARRVAPTGISLVLEGETGTGKERFACAIHRWSGRKGPLTAINCAAIPEPLAEAELFGYREGAFTGAQRASPGHIRAAQGGTLLLDEVTDMPLSVQAKLLRALEQKEVLPVGESRPIPVDVRIVAAAQVPLARAVAERRLRADLQARLDGFTLRIPPLRERREDIPSLFLHLLARHGMAPAVVSPRLVEALCLYGWPLNVRELDFLAGRLAVLNGNEPVLHRAHLPERMRGPAPPGEVEVEAAADPSREEMLAALQRARGNLSRAAAALGISRYKMYRLLGDDAPERSKHQRRGLR